MQKIMKDQNSEPVNCGNGSFWTRFFLKLHLSSRKNVKLRCICWTSQIDKVALWHWQEINCTLSLEFIKQISTFYYGIFLNSESIRKTMPLVLIFIHSCLFSRFNKNIWDEYQIISCPTFTPSCNTADTDILYVPASWIFSTTAELFSPSTIVFSPS